MEDTLKKRKKLVVVGGGASGFFCAINAAALGSLDVIILEKSSKVLSKVKASGGGRCNVTHALFDRQELVQRYPRGQSLLKKTFHHFFTKDTIAWFEQRGVLLKEEADGRMFPTTNDAQTIVDCLLQESQRYGIKIGYSRTVEKIERHDEQFILVTTHGENIIADFVCIACGGFPKESSYAWIHALGHSIVPPVPSLFTLNLPEHSIHSLMGVSVPSAKVKLAGTKIESEGPLLITHWGLSGPAVLKLSAFGARVMAAAQWHCTVHLQWDSQWNEPALRDAIASLRIEQASQKIAAKCPFNLPSRLWTYLLTYTSIDPQLRWADLSSKLQNLLIKNLSAFEVSVKGKTTFKEEFVTAGGVTLSEVDPNTMMSRLLPGLFFTGEVLDVDGITGGFNFQHAWTSGWLAAREIARLSVL